ncbi:hypothetical protein CLOSTMETH_01286 [[Clostridium] methylpentosum DSM 5476]|uniref:Uncharacterized protein n=1 Tax=[Clostridium] methylpentosum DSM 5476 TaxID=537013 RepID=C0EBR8_9FIRM|nr:hypothetical protein CLOSTMETH_01286 [[Clostridium] methylpentosum DSM 5476]
MSVFADSPSPHLSPLKTMYYPKKRCLQEGYFYAFAAFFLFGLCKHERTENTMRYTSKYRLFDTTKAKTCQG